MNQLRKLAIRWARLLSQEPRPIASVFPSLALGCVLVGIFFLRTSHPAFLIAGVFLMTMAITRFERVGFIALLHERLGDEDRNPKDGRQDPENQDT